MIKKSNEQTLKDALELLFARNGSKEKYDNSRIVWAWEKYLGEDMKRCWSTAYVKDKTLFVKITSSAFKENLKYQSSEIVIKLNEMVGFEVISDIKFL